MFGQLFGDYLIRNGIISKDQFNEVMEQQKATRVKLGLIAAAEKLLTGEQAEEVNRLQLVMDKRFGDIAIEKGYLTEAQVSRLLSLQGNPYLLFVQTLIEKSILTLKDIESHLGAYQQSNHYSDNDIEALKSGDMDRIVPLFVHIESPLYNELIGLAVRNMIRFISSDIVLEKSYGIKEYSFETLACQKVKGQHNIFLGFAAKGSDLLAVASPFAKEDFTEINEDSYDAVCEFINCINGLFATKLSHEDIELDMLPPLSYSNGTVVSGGQIAVVPVTVGDKKIDLLVSIDDTTDVK